MLWGIVANNVSVFAGFSQLRSVKGIKHEREKQEMCSALSSAINASLDASGAVAALVPSARPRFLANRPKKAVKLNHSQDDGLTNTVNSFDSSRASAPLSHDGDYARTTSLKRNDAECPKHPSVPTTTTTTPTTRRQQRQSYSQNDETVKGGNCKQVSADVDGCAEEYVNFFTSPKDSTENINSENQNDENLAGISEITGAKRPYYWQKAQKFRTSWRTQSIESPPQMSERCLSTGRSLTMVESGSESDTGSNEATADSAAQVKVYVTRGSCNPVKTILVRNNAGNTTAAAHAAHLRQKARRQKTFANRNQWNSVQLSPTHDVDVESTAPWRTAADNQQFKSRSLCKSHDDYLNKGCLHKSSCNCTARGTWAKTSLTQLIQTTESTEDMFKLKQVSRSSDAPPTSILKSQASRQVSDLQSSDNGDMPYKDPIFSLRHQR